LVQFIDLPKTILSLAGVDLPESMTGRVFLGEGMAPAPESIFLFSGRFDEAPDHSRAVTDGRWKYIRNFEPDRPGFQMLSFPLQQEGQRAQLAAYRLGLTNPWQGAIYAAQPSEELYDTFEDPHEVRNLAATEPAKLAQMRQRLRDHILQTHDLGFIPEPLMEAVDLSGGPTLYEFGQDPVAYPLERVLDTAWLASRQDPDSIGSLVQALGDPNPCVRYWAALGLRVLGERAKEAEPAIEAALSDSSPSVRITAAVALGGMGQRARAAELLLEAARRAELDREALWALDGLKLIGVDNPFAGMSSARMDSLGRGPYSSRLVAHFKSIAEN
jgi:hypothetical protein